MHILEVDTAGKTVADLGPPVPDSAPANLDITVTAKSVPRPSNPHDWSCTARKNGSTAVNVRSPCTNVRW